MAEVVNTIDFALIDENIEAKRLTEPLTKPSVKQNPSIGIGYSEWDDIPTEQPPRVDWNKFTASTSTVTKGGGFDWSHYKPEDDDDFFKDIDDDPLDAISAATNIVNNYKNASWDDDYMAYDNKTSSSEGLTYYRNVPARDPWWEKIGDTKKSDIPSTGKWEETTLDDLYNMIVEVQTRVDTISSNLDDLTDTVKARYANMNKLINAIYARVSEL